MLSRAKNVNTLLARKIRPGSTIHVDHTLTENIVLTRKPS